MVDVNDGQWTQIVTDRHEAISLPDDSETLVFDYDDHDDVDDSDDDNDNDDGSDDPTLAIVLAPHTAKELS